MGVGLSFGTLVAAVPAKAPGGSVPADLDDDGSAGETGDCRLGDQASRVGIDVGKKHLPSLSGGHSTPALAPAGEQGLAACVRPSTFVADQTSRHADPTLPDVLRPVENDVRQMWSQVISSPRMGWVLRVCPGRPLRSAVLSRRQCQRSSPLSTVLKPRAAATAAARQDLRAARTVACLPRPDDIGLDDLGGMHERHRPEEGLQLMPATRVAGRRHRRGRARELPLRDRGQKGSSPRPAEP